MDLFHEQGFDNTTVEQIVAATGMSRSTFFRYFANKEDVVLREVVAYGQRIAAALSQRPAQEPIWTALRMALDPLIHPDDDEQARQANRMFNSSPSLKARHYEKTLSWQRLLIPEIAHRLGSEQTGESDPRPAALASSALACYDAAITCWISEENDTPLAALLDTAMHAVRPDSAQDKYTARS